ncbi:MAG: Gfo/Idh/MocA family oxidoreductase [Daejeonella sp.]
MKALVVGLGSIGKKHINALLTIDPKTEIFALRSSVNAKVVSDITSIYTFDSLPTAIDFAIISNPTNLHYQVIIALSKKGIPLFIEKPLVHSLDVIDDLLKNLNDNQTTTYVACNLRFHPCLQYVNDFMQKSADVIVNEINIYCGSYLPNWRPGKNFREMYSAKAELGGGVHLDLFHELDYLTWIFGIPEKTRVIKTNHSSLKISAIDYANINFYYPTFTANIILNYYRITPKRTFEIIFDGDVWLVDLIKCQITNFKNEIIFEDPTFSISDTYTSQLEYFIGALKEKKVMMNTAQESAAILRICLTDE